MMIIRPLGNVLSTALFPTRRSNLTTTMACQARALRGRVAEIRTIVHLMERFAKRHHQHPSPELEKHRIHFSPTMITTIAQNMTLAHHRLFPHLVANVEYAGSVCQIMGRSRVPMESVGLTVQHLAVRHRRPNRIGTRVLRHSTPIYPLARHHPTPTAVEYHNPHGLQTICVRDI